MTRSSSDDQNTIIQHEETTWNEIFRSVNDNGANAVQANP